MNPTDKEALFALKAEDNLTDRDLAELAGVSAQTIGRWRAARRRSVVAAAPGLRRRLVMTRPDGTVLEIAVTDGEMLRLLRAGAG